MALLAEPLVGRDAELALLEGVLDEACAGTHKFGVIAGEPGIGKTSLLKELCRMAEDRGCLVFEGRATELERSLPFGLIVDGFDAYLESLDPQTYDRLAADGLDELASVFPSLRSLGDGSEPRTPAERFRAHHAVRELVERLAARQPVVMAFDDVHWSDGASRELLEYLLRRPIQGAVLGFITYRPGQVSAAVTATVEEAVRTGQVTRIALGPLTHADAARLVPDESSAASDRLYEESGGNPFYLLQLARSGDGITPAPATKNVVGVPTAVTAAIGRELDGLDDPVRTLVDGAAVAGDPFEIDVAVATAAMTEPDALTALDELIARDLVRPTDVPRRFQFRHPLVRAAVYDGCSPGARLSAHERAADALAERGAPPALRAHHVEQSARHGDAAAVAVLREAGQAASERAPTSAARWFAAALRILPADAPAGERAELLVGLAVALIATGRLEAAYDALVETLAIAADDAPMPRVKLIASCAGLEELLGRHRDAHARLEAALRAEPDHESADAGALMFALGIDAFYEQDYAAMLDWGKRALAVATKLDDRPLIGAAAGLSAFAASLRPETIAEAHEHHAQATAVVDAMSDEDLAKDLNGVGWLAPADFYLDHYPEGIAHAERGVAVTRATGQSDFFPGIVQALANLLFQSGRPDEASQLLDDAIQSARLSNNKVGLAWSLLNRGFCATCAGDLEDALKTGDEAMRLTEEMRNSPVAAWAAAVYGIALLDTGDAAQAYQVLLTRCGGDELPLIPGPWHVNWLMVMTRCLLALDRVNDAERMAELCDAEAARYSLPLSTANAKRAKAAVAFATGDVEQAAELALASAAGAEEVGARLEAAHARMLAGSALARAGDKEAATAEFERAAAEFDACAAPRYRQMAEQELRKLGQTVHRRTQRGKADGAGAEALTGREMEIAKLVVDRRTNPEIASELFLSIKTVETHMRNIFRKLDVSSRVEVARVLERDLHTG